MNECAQQYGSPCRGLTGAESPVCSDVNVGRGAKDSTSRVLGFQARVFIKICMLECGRKDIELEKTNTYRIRQLENQHTLVVVTYQHLLSHLLFRWVKGNSSLRAPNGSSFIFLQQCLLKIQQCILTSCPAASEGSWPTSKRQEMSSSQGVPKCS